MGKYIPRLWTAWVLMTMKMTDVKRGIAPEEPCGTCPQGQSGCYNCAERQAYEQSLKMVQAHARLLIALRAIALRR